MFFCFFFLNVSYSLSVVVQTSIDKLEIAIYTELCDFYTLRCQSWTTLDPLITWLLSYTVNVLNSPIKENTLGNTTVHD